MWHLFPRAMLQSARLRKRKDEKVAIDNAVQLVRMFRWRLGTQFGDDRPKAVLVPDKVGVPVLVSANGTGSTHGNRDSDRPEVCISWPENE